MACCIAHLVILINLLFAGITDVMGQQLVIALSTQDQGLFSTVRQQLPQSDAVNTAVNTQPAGSLPLTSLRPNTAMFQQNPSSGPIGTQLMASAMTSSLPNTGPLPTFINSQQPSSAVPATNQLTSTLIAEQPSSTTTTKPITIPTGPTSPVPLPTVIIQTSYPVRPPTGVNTGIWKAITSSTGPISTPQLPSVAAPQPAPIRVQVVLADSFNSTAGLSNGANTTTYVASLIPSIANACRVSYNRITDVSATSQPDTGFLLVRFTIQPPLSVNCIDATCDVSLQKAFDSFKSLANDETLVIRDFYSNNLTVAVINFNVQVTAWTDNGPCPVSLCRLDTEVCDCSLTGTLYCRAVTSTSNSPHRLLYLLLLLLIIPIVVVVVVVLVVVFRRRNRKQRQQPLKKVNLRADMLSYKEYVTRTEKQPKVSTIASRYTDDGLGTMFRSLGENVSIAFNSTTFVDPSDDRSSGDSIITNDTTVAE